MKYICFELQLPKVLLDNISEADDPNELIAIPDRYMADMPHRHQLHDILGAILRGADDDRLRHQFGDGDRWQPASVCRKAIGNIALGYDATDRVSVAAHDRGTNLLGAQGG